MQDIAWGSAESGGDSTSVQDQLNNAQHIQASLGAFAAILGDGSVVTWGDTEFGGDSTTVQDQLKNVQQIRASDGAFMSPGAMLSMVATVALCKIS